MAETSLVKKLLIKPGNKVLVMNAPDDYVLGALPEGADVKTSGQGPFDVVQCFVRSKAEVDSLASKAIKAVKTGGMLWFVYPKKTSKIKTDIHRDVGWDAVQSAGWEGIALVSVDDTWSAMRYRPAEDVKSRKRS